MQQFEQQRTHKNARKIVWSSLNKQADQIPFHILRVEAI